MPSRFEPCGLNQMFAMRYGTVPIARETGGLKDTVVDYQAGGTGISFSYDSVDDLSLAISRALYLYKEKDKLIEVRNRGIKSDYSWKKSAKIYSDIYNKLIA
jgi:starch synthase